jgi:cysteine-rich repeat protein
MRVAYPAARRVTRGGVFWLGFGTGCGEAPAPGAEGPGASTPWVAPGCGNGVLEADELCDDGDANSDLSPDACRTDCRPARCGDGALDAGEACDDGGVRGGDGCSPSCAPEDGALEVEPNDEGATASPGGDGVFGALDAGDRDCWSVVLPACGALRATEVAPCTGGLVLEALAPDGSLLAAGGPGADGCALLDPLDEPGARWVEGGSWAVCARSPTGSDVPGYELSIELLDPLTEGLPPTGPDLDGDGVPDVCDADRDGDGVDDAADNCPDVSNGPASPPLSLTWNGYVLDWLAVGPYTTGLSAQDCRPSEDPFVGEGGVVAPRIGDTASGLAWTAHIRTWEVFDFLPSYGFVDAPREVYALAYLVSTVERSATLSVGADDGVFAWWNGARVMDVSSCQGVVADQFQAPVTVAQGVNTVLFKVRDEGGGWGVMAHLLDAGGAPIVDLVPSLDPSGAQPEPQADSDGDGIGDLCDSTP